MEYLIEALKLIRDEAGSHTVVIFQRTGFAKIYGIADGALRVFEAQQQDSTDKCEHNWKHYPIKPGGFTKCTICGKSR